MIAVLDAIVELTLGQVVVITALNVFASALVFGPYGEE